MKQWSGWVGENCFTEGSNVSLAKFIFGPKPKHHAHQAADCIITHTEEVYRKRATEAHKHLQESKQKRKQNAEETDENLAQRLLSSDIVGVKNDSSFDQYCLSHNYECAEVVRTDSVITAPPEHCRKFVVKYAKVAPAEPTHRRPTYLRTRTVTVTEVKIKNEIFVCVVCSCSFFRYEKHACRHLYRVFQRFPSLQDFMPECFKTYEVCYGSDTQYT